jgi:hypothetical protein
MIFGQRWSGLSCIQVIETDHPVDPNGELAGVYKRVGAGGTVDRPAGRSNQTVRGFATVSAIGLLHREHKL